MGDRVFDYCGLGNIVKGVKKRKKKCDPRGGQQNRGTIHQNYSQLLSLPDPLKTPKFKALDTFPNDDQLRSNESLHTLLSKLDIVEKKIEKLDRTQTVKSMAGVSQDNQGSKLKVYLPDNWLELMNDYKTGGSRPCLEVSVKSETDHNCWEESQKGATGGRTPVQTNLRNKQRSCSCEMARSMERRCGILESCESDMFARPQESDCPAGQSNKCPADTNSSHQYASVNSSGACGESPDMMPSSEAPKYRTFTPPLSSTEILPRNNRQLPPRPNERECSESAPVEYPSCAPSESSIFTPPLCSTPKLPSNRRQPRVTMETGYEEINSEMDYPENQRRVNDRLNLMNISPTPCQPKRAEGLFDSGYLPNKKSPCTNGCCPSHTAGYDPYPNSSVSKRRDQQMPCPSCRVVPPTSCQDDSSKIEMNSCMSFSDLPPTTKKGKTPCKTCAPSRNCKQVLQTNNNNQFSTSSIAPEKYNKPDGVDVMNVSPKCFCVHAICMIQNCPKHMGQRQRTENPLQIICPDESEFQEINCPFSGSSESPIRTWVDNIPESLRDEDSNVPPRTPIVTSSPGGIKSDAEMRNVDNAESGRIAPLKSCECDIINESSRRSKCSPHNPKLMRQKHEYGNGLKDSPNRSTHSPNSQKKQSILEKQCSLPPSEKESTQHSHHENVDSTNDAALDNEKASPHNPKSVPEKREHADANGAKGSPSRSTHSTNSQKERSTPGKKVSLPPSEESSHRENTDSTNNTASDNKEASPHNPKSVPEKREHADANGAKGSPSRSTHSTNSQKERSTPGKKVSLPPSEESSHRENTDSTNNTASDNKEASPHNPKSVPEKREHADANGAKDSPKNVGPHEKTDRSLYVQDGTEFIGRGESQYPINPSGKNWTDLPGTDLLPSLTHERQGLLPLPLVAPSDTILHKVMEECDFRSCSIGLPLAKVKRDMFIGEGTVLTSHPSSIISTPNEYSTDNVTAPKKHRNTPSNKYKRRDHYEEKSYKAEEQWHEDKTTKKCANLKPVVEMKVSGQDRTLYFHNGNASEEGQRARSRPKKRVCSPVGPLSRSISSNSKRNYGRVGDRERQRIHQLARESISKRSPTGSVEDDFCPESHHSGKTKRSNHAIPPVELPPFPASSVSANSRSRSLNEKYMKELMLPFAHQGADRSKNEESDTPKNVQKFVIERMIRINPHTQEMEKSSQFIELSQVEEGSDEFVPENTEQLTISLEQFVGSKPEISGSSICPTGFAPSAASQPPCAVGALESRTVSSNRINDLLRDTLMRLYDTEPLEEERSEDSSRDRFLHRVATYGDPSDQPHDVFEDAFAGAKQQSSDGRFRKYETVEEFLKESIIKQLFSQLQGEVPGSRDSTRNGFQNQASSMIFHHDVKRIIVAPRKQLASSSTEDHDQDNPLTPSEVPLDVQLNPDGAFNEGLNELIWNSHYIPSDSPDSDKTVYVPTADSLAMAFRVNSETKTDPNRAHQKSYVDLRKASEIMDLLEIFPGQRKLEDPQDDKTRKWIEKIHRELEYEKDRMDYEKTIRTKVKGSRKKDYYSHKTSKARFVKTVRVTPRVEVHKKRHVPVQSVQSSSSTSVYESSTEPVEKSMVEQRFFVYMNKSGYLSKERCKHGVSNHLPKQPTCWFRGTDRSEYSTVQRNSNVTSTDSRPMLTEHEPLVKCKHTTYRHHHRLHPHYKRRDSSDDSLNFKRKITKKKEMIVRKPKKTEKFERQHRDVRVPSRSFSMSSSSDSFEQQKRRVRSLRHSVENDRKTPHVHHQARRDRHRHSLEESLRESKYEERRASKSKGTSVDSSKQKNGQTKKTAMKKDNLKIASSVTFEGSDTSSTDSSSYSSIPSRRDKTHRSHDRSVKHSNNQTARHLKVSHSPIPVIPVKRAKVKKKVPNALHNYRQRLIAPDSKSSVSYEKVNVKDFIDFLATLSRNTISTLTNKKKALRLYRSYLTSPKRR